MADDSEKAANAIIGCGYILLIAAIIFLIGAAGIWLIKH
jgi:hypothetical protein